MIKTFMKVAALTLVLGITTGCEQMTNPETNINQNPDHVVYDFGTGKFRRINIEGVDCVIGAGTYDHTAAVTCDWDRKE